MAFGGFDEGGKTQPMVEINTTPLVDVMLVLLVIFIITAPLFQQAIPIDLPKVDSTRLDEKPMVIQLALNENGQLFLDGELVERHFMDAHFAAVSALKPELHLRADRATRYELLAEIIATAQAAGIVKIAFVTDSPKQ